MIQGLRRVIFWIKTVKIVLNNQWEWNKQSTEKFLGQAKSDIEFKMNILEYIKMHSPKWFFCVCGNVVFVLGSSSFYLELQITLVWVIKTLVVYAPTEGESGQPRVSHWQPEFPTITCAPGSGPAFCYWPAMVDTYS